MVGIARPVHILFKVFKRQLHRQPLSQASSRNRRGRLGTRLLHIACVASVSVWYRSKERPRNGILSFGRARNETRAKIWKWGRKRQISKARIDRSDSLIFQHKRRPRVIGFTYASPEVHFRSTESQTFYWSIMTADDSIKCRCANSGRTVQVGGFQNPGVCLQAFPSFLPHPLPALLLVPFFARSLTLVPLSLLLKRTETLATQAK